MTVTQIRITCDTPDCGAYCQVEAGTPDAAAAHASDRWGWTRRDGRDLCAPCTRGDTPDRRPS